MKFARTLPLLTLGMLVTGCAVGPDYQRPQFALPAAYPEIVKAVQQSIGTDWWTLYGDSTLNTLVVEAIKQNSDIKIAAAQIEEAEALLGQASSSIFPEIDLGAGATRSRVSSVAATPNLPPLIRDDRRLAVSTSFELDFWGKLRRATEAARAQVLASTYGRDVVQLTLVGTTVQGYFTLRSLDAQLTVLESSLKTRDESLDVARSRAAAGLASDLDLNLAIGTRADIASQINELERQRAIALHLLALLTLNARLELPRGNLQSLPIPPAPPGGLPSALLDRRPDVRAAEQSLIAANAQIGVAKAALFPTFSLTGNYGGQSAALESLLSSGGRIWSAGFGLALPIFDAGRNLSKLDQVEARQRQSLFAYQKTVAIAFREVADAITNVNQSAVTEGALQTRVGAARNSLELAQLRYASGYSPYLDVLDAQRTANDAELALVRNRQAQLGYSIDFMKSLGGGWLPTSSAKN
ncbi:MAG: efflux transporter outer membrane subunit [Betaproteobacteria bacterium]